MTNKLKLYLLSIIFLLGYTNMSFELIVLKQLVNFVGSNTMITSIVISTILLFLSIGYYVGSVINFSKYAIRQLILRLTVFLAIWYILACSYYLLGGYFYFSYLIGIRSTTLFVIMFSLLFLSAPAVSLGFITSSIGRIIHHYDFNYTGRFLAVDTAGSVLGSLLTTLIFMPLIGCANTIGILVSLNNAVLLCISKKNQLKLSVINFILLSVLAFVVNNEKIINPQNILIKDDAISRMEIHKTDFFENEYLSKELKINGSGSSKVSQNKELMYDYIKFVNKKYIENLPKNKIHDILILGAGGFTIGIDDNTNNYIYLDIEKILKDVSDNLLLESKLSDNKKFIVEDAYLYMINNKNKFDLIIIDVYSAVQSIPTNFVTIDFFEMIKSSLKQNGIMLANIISSPAFESNFSRRIDNTLREVFKHYLSRQIIQDYNPYEYNLANIVYIYYNLPVDNTIYTINKNSAVYGQELVW